jgi:hypothetical protein
VSSAPKSETLRALYWRSEILRVVYWLRGEGFGDLVDVPLILEFLGDGGEEGIPYIEPLVADGSLVRDGEWYALSDRGLQEGEVEFATAFSDLLHPSSGQCSPECWCQTSPIEAEACGRQRARSETSGKANR